MSASSSSGSCHSPCQQVQVRVIPSFGEPSLPRSFAAPTSLAVPSPFPPTHSPQNSSDKPTSQISRTPAPRNRRPSLPIQLWILVVAPRERVRGPPCFAEPDDPLLGNSRRVPSRHEDRLRRLGLPQMPLGVREHERLASLDAHAHVVEPERGPVPSRGEDDGSYQGRVRCSRWRRRTGSGRVGGCRGEWR